MKSSMEGTLGKSSRQVATKGRQHLKNYHLQAAKQYNSMCEELETPIAPQLRQRQHSKKDVRHEQLSKLVRSKSRHIEKSNDKKPQESKKHDIGALYSELMAVKSQYKKLKGSYETLAKQKIELTARGLTGPLAFPQKTGKEIQRCQKTIQLLQGELQRIRKECLRVVQTQKFKNRRLQEIIQQKDLTIAYLRGQLDRQKKWHETATTNQTLSYCSDGYQMVGSVNCSQIENVVVDGRKDEDSLCFSCDPSKDMESVSSLLGRENPKKDQFIVQPLAKVNDFTQPSQCLTFEQRQEEPAEIKEAMKMPPRQTKKAKPKQPRKTKLATQFDQNLNRNGREQPATALAGGFPKQRKKPSSCKRY